MKRLQAPSAALCAAAVLLGCDDVPTEVGPGRSRELLDRISAVRPDRVPPRDAFVVAELPERADGAVHLRDVRSGFAASVRLLDTRPVMGETVGRSVLYSSPFVTPGAGAAWVQRPFEGGTEDFVVFEVRPRDARVRYEVSLGSAKHVRLVSNVLELLDDRGAPRLRMLPPRIYSSAEVCASSGCRGEPVTVSVRGCAVDRDPRAPWRRHLPAPDATACVVELSWEPDLRYPAVLDPTWTNAQMMMAPRVGHSMTLLADGDVLVAGGEDPAAQTSAELFDPDTLAFSPVGPTVQPMMGHASVRLDDGTVLLMRDGQVDAYANGSFTNATPTLTSHTDGAAIRVGAKVLLVSADGLAEIYDPLTEEWTDVSSGFSLGSGRLDLVELDDGRVFAGAGLFDPTTLQWTPSAPQPNIRSFSRATKLLDGRVLVSGGSSYVLFWPTSFNVYSPDPLGGPGQWTTLSPTGGLARRGHHAVRLASGAVLLLSGIGETYSPTTDVRAFDPVSSHTISYPPRDEGRQRDELVVLADGRLLLTGGIGFPSEPTIARVLAPDLAGAPCSSPAACASGFCVDGVCCDAACDTACESCVASEKGFGADGVCAALLPGAADGACPDEGPSSCGTTGHCAAGGTCAVRELGAQCGISSCVAGTLTNVACDGVGNCVPANVACSPFVCGVGAACAVSCASDVGCVSGYTCEEGTCVANLPLGAPCDLDAQCAGGLCGDDGTCGSPRCIGVATLRVATGATEECAPYVCTEGACVTRCSSVLDCTLGTVCDGDGLCVAASAAPAFDGCAVSAPRADDPRWAGWAAAAAALAATALRRRARTPRRARSR